MCPRRTGPLGPRAYCKSVDPMAARLAPHNVRRWHQSPHQLVADAPWSDEAVLDSFRWGKTGPDLDRSPSSSVKSKVSRHLLLVQEGAEVSGAVAAQVWKVVRTGRQVRGGADTESFPALCNIPDYPSSECASRYLQGFRPWRRGIVCVYPDAGLSLEESFRSRPIQAKASRGVIDPTTTR